MGKEGGWGEYWVYWVLFEVITLWVLAGRHLWVWTVLLRNTCYWVIRNWYDSFLFKIFTGNTDWRSVVSHLLTPPINTRFIRILPEEWQSYIAMRVEFYGCRGGGEGEKSSDPFPSFQVMPTRVFPWLSRPASLPSFLRVPLEGLPCDVSNRFPESVADPFPFPTSDADPLLLSVLPEVIF